jgi:predicted Rossmann fold nucleotide-binding protein DprA/Smf involved in DNA uptake
MLIKNGEAKCVMQSLDVLEEYDALIRQSAHKKQLPLLDEIESQIYTLISDQDMDIDTLALKLTLETRDVTMKLSLLELKNIVKKDIS